MERLMPTTRTPINRAAKKRVTPEAIDLFRRCLALRPIRDKHLLGMCPGPINEHCPDCLSFNELNRELDRLLGIKPWMRSPVDVDCADPPPYMANNPLQAGYWAKAWALRRLLEC
jgi:hypothetical protein